MSTTPSMTTAVALPSSAQAGTTTFNPVVTQSLAFFGWASVGDQSGTAVYSPANCGVGSSFSASSLFATCCPIAGAGCPLYTSCGQNSVLYGLEATSACDTGAVCKTDILYESQSGIATSVFFCNTGTETSFSFYRTLPTPGFVYAQSTSNTLANGPIVLSAGAIGGLAISVVIVLAFCAAVVYFCRRCARGSRGPYVEPIPLTAREQRRQQNRAAERAVNDKYLQNQKDQVELNRQYDLAMRLNPQ